MKHPFTFKGLTLEGSRTRLAAELGFEPRVSNSKGWRPTVRRLRNKGQYLSLENLSSIISDIADILPIKWVCPIILISACPT